MKMSFDERLYKIRRAHTLVINKYIITEKGNKKNTLIIDPKNNNTDGTMIFRNYDAAAQFIKDNDIPMYFTVQKVGFGIFLNKGYYVKKIYQSIRIIPKTNLEEEGDNDEE